MTDKKKMQNMTEQPNKLQGMKEQDMKMTDQMTGHEIAVKDIMSIKAGRVIV